MICAASQQTRGAARVVGVPYFAAVSFPNLLRDHTACRSHCGFSPLINLAAGKRVSPRISRKVYWGGTGEPRLTSRWISSLTSFAGGQVSDWAVLAVVATCAYAAYLRWLRQQQLFVQSGACAAAANLYGDSSCGMNADSDSNLSRIHEATGRAIEYIYLANPRLDTKRELAARGEDEDGDVLLFFHGGLGGSDQLLASGLSFPRGIKHILLPNRLGYLRSDPPPQWEEPRQVRILRQRKGSSTRQEKDGGRLECERLNTCKSRMQQQAALFHDLVKRIFLQQRNRQASLGPWERGGLHLLGVGEGCAHAIVYAHFFPQHVKSISLLSPVFQMHQHTLDGALERHIVKRIQMYRQIVQRLPVSAPRPPLPPPKLSFLEWLTTGACKVAPSMLLKILLFSLCHTNPQACPSAQQLLSELHKQHILSPLLQHPNERQSNTSSSKCTPRAKSWREQQQDAWEAQQYLHGQMLRRVQHVTGTRYVAQRLQGFMEDALLLTPWDEAGKQAGVDRWLLECLAQLQIPGLVVNAGKGNTTLIRHSPSKHAQALLEFVELPNAHPQIMLLSHASQLNTALEKLYARCAFTEST